MLLAISKPETRLPCLERRVPGETDLRIFTTEPIPAGKHRLERGRLRLRVLRDRLGGGPIPRVGASEAGRGIERAKAGAGSPPADSSAGTRGLPIESGELGVRSLALFPWHDRRRHGESRGAAGGAVSRAEAGK